MIRKRLTLSAAALMILMCSACNSSEAGTGETETSKSEIELSEESGDVPETDSIADEKINENAEREIFDSDEVNVPESNHEYSQNIIDEAEEELNENTDESVFYSEENNVRDSDSEYSQNIIDEAEYDS